MKGLGKKLGIALVLVFIASGNLAGQAAPRLPMLSAQPVAAAEFSSLKLETGTGLKSQVPEACLEGERVKLVIANGYVVFVDSTPLNPAATAWPQDAFDDLVERYRRVIQDGYAGSHGFGDLDVWARESGITLAPAECPDCPNAGGALRIMYVPGAANQGGWYGLCGIQLPGIQHGTPEHDFPGKGVIYHELAHVWDRTLDESRFGPSLEIAMGVQRVGRVVDQGTYQKGKPNHGDFPTAYSMSWPSEHLADSVESYFLTDEYAAGSLSDRDVYEYETQVGICWVDEDSRCQPGAHYEYDRYDFVRQLFRSR
jgi:hypothetical protein